MNLKSRFIALLSYLSILFLFPLNFFRKDEFIHYHAKQGVVLFILAMALTFTFWVPILAWICWLAYLVIWMTGIINALSGKKEPVPVIGVIGERIPL
ncbi:hypothetical protein AUJ40_01400 [Candidatus Berkelbacteria bacterium CG1_02_42_45]|uniref:Magnetosome protein MamF n=1 Tax=Candidatus Berkelbacteria bacterium CG1_02_42_45 TaxID=1805036 RepID=A0A1J4RUZ8_9BACT|nr:MAG: hypothetical protein AUJ40_01400 [Candidatus Berkelbacteria bacterium CG1_02_42_45]